MKAKTSFTSVFVHSTLVDYLFAFCSTILMEISRIRELPTTQSFLFCLTFDFRVLPLNEKDGKDSKITVTERFRWGTFSGEVFVRDLQDVLQSYMVWKPCTYWYHWHRQNLLKRLIYRLHNKASLGCLEGAWKHHLLWSLNFLEFQKSLLLQRRHQPMPTCLLFPANNLLVCRKDLCLSQLFQVQSTVKARNLHKTFVPALIKKQEINLIKWLNLKVLTLFDKLHYTETTKTRLLILKFESGNEKGMERHEAKLKIRAEQKSLSRTTQILTGKFCFPFGVANKSDIIHYVNLSLIHKISFFIVRTRTRQILRLTLFVQIKCLITLLTSKATSNGGA